ncbi:MAG: FHA domain-containing protein [Steroidobacteraceae bacterium]
MSPQSPKPDQDLDRTDELPRLDVAAYEAAMRRGEEDPLSRTDTWVVRALHDADLQDEFDEGTQRHLRPVAEPAVRLRQPEPTQDVTAEVERILTRIDELERELETTRGDSQRWQTRCNELSAERAEQEERAGTLTANNARLVEQQQIAYDRTQLLEARMREEAELAQKRIAELQNTLHTERTTHAELKQRLEQQVSEARVQIETLSRNQLDTQSQLTTQTALAQTRAREIGALQTGLADQRRAASDMARLLASKMTEYEALLTELDRRETALTALEGVRLDLSEQLDAMTEAEHTRSTELEQARTALAAARTSEQQLQRALTERQQDIVQRDSQLQQVRGELAQTIQERDTTRVGLSDEQKSHASAKIQMAALAQQHEAVSKSLESTTAQLHARTAELEEAQRLIAQRQDDIQRHEQEAQVRDTTAHGLRGELERALEHIVHLVAQRDQLTTARTDLDTRLTTLATEFEAQQTQWVATQTSATDLRSELDKAQKLAGDRAEALLLTQEALDDLRSSSSSAEAEMAQASAQLQRLQAQLQEQTRELEAHQLELSASRAEVGRQTRTQEDLERAVRLRDDLLHTLRQELQTAQAEHGIMSGQLDKARARTKSLAERIFQKDARIATLRADLAVHSEALAAIRRDVKTGGDADAERVLEPIGHEGPPVVLNRKVMTVGRTEDNDVCVPSKMVSRRHARLLVGPNAVIVEDTGSTNGCYVNDQSVRKHLLREGDVLLIGDRKYKLRSGQPDAAT